MNKYDVFISYRRVGGFETAQLLSDRLKAQGYRVFFDMHTMRSGSFGQQLSNVIDQCRDLVVVLSSGALDPLKEGQEDWLRMEVERALEKQKNVIPFMTRGFKFDDVPPLPPEIEPLRMQHGLEASQEHFDAVVSKLRKLLKSRPVAWRSKKVWASVAVLLCAVVWPLASWVELKSSHFPSGRHERSLAKEMLSTAGQFIQAVDAQHEYLQKFLEACDEAETDGLTAERFGELRQDADHCIAQMEPSRKAFQPPRDSLIAGLRETSMNTADLMAMDSYLQLSADDMQNTMETVLQIMDPTSLYPAATRKKMIALYKQWNKESARMAWFSFCEFLVPVDDSALQPILTHTLPSLHFLYSEIKDLERDQTRCKSQQDAAFNQLQGVLADIGAQVGDLDKLNRSMEQRVDEVLAQAAAQKALADKELSVAEKQNALIEKEAQVADQRQKLNVLYDQVAKKAEILPTDQTGEIWNKMLLLLRIGRKEQALANLTAFEEKSQEAGEPVMKYTRVAQEFIRQQIPALPAGEVLNEDGSPYFYKGAVLVFGFAGDAAHSSLQVGDIVMAIDGESVENGTQFVALKKARAGKDFSATVLRLDASGQFQTLELPVLASDPPIGVCSLKVDE